MSQLFLTSIDLNSNQVLGLRLEVLAADPSGGALYEGRLWFNSTDNFVKYYDGTTIIPLSAAAAAGVSSLVVDSVTIEDVGSASVPSLRVKALGIGAGQLANTISLTKFVAPTADFDLGTHKLTGVADPTNPQDAATKAYVDATSFGLDWKASVRAATVANLAALSAPQTVDGVALIAGDRVLVKNQTAGGANGIYVVAAGAWARATDADAASEVTAGFATFVSEGTVNGNTAFVLTTDDPIVVGTTSLVFTQIAGPGSYTAGAGLTLAGTQFALTIPVAVASGGTGGTTAAAAKTALGFLTRFAVDVNAALTTTVTHNLGTRDVSVTVYDTTTYAEVLADVSHPTTNTVVVGFAIAPAAGAYRVVVVG